MIILSIILLIVGYIAGIHPLVTIGWILLVVGLALLFLGATGTSIGGRNNWY